MDRSGALADHHRLVRVRDIFYHFKAHARNTVIYLVVYDS